MCIGAIKMKKETISDVTDYIIVKVNEGDDSLNLLKLQKLLYYVQAWYLAFYKEPLFEGKFEAWVHGPVNRIVFDRFKDSLGNGLYTKVNNNCIRSDFDLENNLDIENSIHIDAVLEEYARFTGSQLEDLSHREDPWIFARKGLNPNESSKNEIDEVTMQNYYFKKAKLAMET
jgi:uncharacterized phage-associated protein